MDKNIEPINQKIVALSDIPEGSKIHAITNLSVDGKKSVITFHHLDGMYSYCTVDGVESGEGRNLLHLSFATPLVKVDDHYELAIEDQADEDEIIELDDDMPPADQE